jgi:phosphatidylglycerophosphate synthase
LARAAAAWLGGRGLRPNQISLLGIAFASLAGGCLAVSARGGVAGRPGLLVAAAGGILLRLLCNLFDGMLAVEGGQQSPAGPVFNELPDRIADAIILVGAGYATGPTRRGRELGWLAGLLAVLTAHVRLLGAALGLPQDFGGPMAKPRRMAVVIAACLATALGSAFGWRGQPMVVGLSLVVVGGAATVARRTRGILRALDAGRA